MSQPGDSKSRVLRAGPDFGFRGDGAESPPLAKGQPDDYGETVLTKIDVPRTPDEEATNSE